MDGQVGTAAQQYNTRERLNTKYPSRAAALYEISPPPVSFPTPSIDNFVFLTVARGKCSL